MKDSIEVSVLCITYNHAPFIRRALEGFVNQKTNFKFEVLVHDDASTDGTPDIIREYEKKYPEIIKPIYQTENQYSKGVSIGKTYLWPRIKGKYVANCEGDDYWCDNGKLQKQYDFMEAHPDYSACFHCALTVYYNSRTQGFISPQISESRDFSIEEVIRGDGPLFATASMFRRKELLFNRPDCFSAKGFSDYQAVMYAAIIGKIYCLKDVMSVYNSGVPGSFTQRMQNNNAKLIEHFQDKIRMLKAVDAYYNGIYHLPLEDAIHANQYYLLRCEGDWKKILKSRFRFKYLKDHLKNIGLKILSPFLHRFFPFVLEWRKALITRAIKKRMGANK